MTADLLALLDELDAARAKATPGPWWHLPYAGVGTRSINIAECGRPEDAALIVAAVNALPDLIADARKLDAVVRAMGALADELEHTGMTGGATARLRAVLADVPDPRSVIP